MLQSESGSRALAVPTNCLVEVRIAVSVADVLGVATPIVAAGMAAAAEMARTIEGTKNLISATAQPARNPSEGYKDSISGGNSGVASGRHVHGVGGGGGGHSEGGHGSSDGGGGDGGRGSSRTSNISPALSPAALLAPKRCRAKANVAVAARHDFELTLSLKPSPRTRCSAPPPSWQCGALPPPPASTALFSARVRCGTTKKGWRRPPWQRPSMGGSRWLVGHHRRQPAMRCRHCGCASGVVCGGPDVSPADAKAAAA